MIIYLSDNQSQKAYGEVQEQMVQELQVEKQRLKTQYKQHVLQQTVMQNNTNNTNIRGVEIQVNGSGSSRASVAHDKATAGTASRSTRSTVPALDLSNVNGEYVSADSKLEMLFNSTRTAVGNASTALLAGLPMGGRNTTRRKPTNNVVNSGIPPLDQVLSENNMR